MRILFKCVSKKYIIFNTLSVSKIEQNLLEMLNKKWVYQNVNPRQMVSWMTFIQNTLWNMLLAT